MAKVEFGRIDELTARLLTTMFGQKDYDLQLERMVGSVVEAMADAIIERGSQIIRFVQALPESPEKRECFGALMASNEWMELSETDQLSVMRCLLTSIVALQSTTVQGIVAPLSTEKLNSTLNDKLRRRVNEWKIMDGVSEGTIQ